MTSRTLVAGARAARGEGPAAKLRSENQALAQFYGCLVDISMVAHQARPLIAANTRLAPKLNDPALMNHPKRSEYLALFESRDLQIRVLKQNADPFLREFAAIWQRLPEERRESIRSKETDWPQDANPAVLAVRVWQWMASDAFLWPSKNECPF